MQPRRQKKARPSQSRGGQTRREAQGRAKKPEICQSDSTCRNFSMLNSGSQGKIQHNEVVMGDTLLVTLMKDRLNKAIQESEISKKGLADACGVGASSVSQWLSGNTKSISSEHIFRAARALGVSPEWLATGNGPMRLTSGNTSGLRNHPPVPILNWNMAQIAALATDDGPGEHAPYVGGGERTFALRIEGDSMVGPEKCFQPGELIHVDPDDREASVGQFVLARILSSDMVVFRQLQSDAGSPYLRALNSQFARIFEPFEILGRVVGRSETL